MTPEQLQQFEAMQTRITKLEQAENVSFIGNIERRLGIARIVEVAVSKISLGSLTDVDVPSPSNGQVLKFTTSGDDRWVAATDNIE